MRRWRERDHRELPWLAGDIFSAFSAAGVPSPSGRDTHVLGRFLVGAETDVDAVRDAIDRAGSAPQGPPLPPDARGALVDAVDHAFDELVKLYTALHPVVRDGHRRYVDEVLDDHRSRMDAAVADVHERARVLAGVAQPPPPPRRRRGPKDRNGVAIAFVLLALFGAMVMVYLVLQGWPLVSYDFPL